VDEATNPPPPSATAEQRAAAEARGLFEQANERQRAGDAAAAVALYGRAIARFPAFPDALNNLAITLKAQRQLPAAIACLQRALLYAPQSAALYSNLGNMLWVTLAFDEARAAFLRALALDATRPEIHHNLGLLQFSLGDYNAAIECYDRGLTLQPGNRTVQWDRALALLASGDYARGFAAYDVRFDLDDPTLGFDRKLRGVRNITLPLWQGEELAGRTLYVYAEQGLGDTLQFARFLPMVAARGARIVFDCAPGLLRLFENFPGIAVLRPEDSPLPPADFHLPMMSLPHRLGITLDNLPARVPYLAPPLTGSSPIVERPPGTRLAIGIVWAGRPHHSNDLNRSLALDHLLELCAVPGLALFSLQTGPRSGDIAAHGAAALVRDLSPQIQDFLDTARLVRQLDLVITVDTAVAHLAGALGRPAFVLLPFTPDWRWLARRQDSPWYPTLRLFRQPAPRDWKSVVRDVREALSRAVAAN
jgi:tetratricopeptide (TPR) repeat protein